MLLLGGVLVLAPSTLGDVYTMNHEVIPRPCRICNWLLNSSWNHFGLHQGKNVKVTIEFEVPKRHIPRHTLSTDMLQWVLLWERQKRCSGRKKVGAHGKAMLL